MDKVTQLEEAILRRADDLAAQYREQARQSRDEILRESSKRLRLREEREVLLGKALAERAYRRRVQSSELKLQSRMDRLRWNLVQAVAESLETQLHRLVDDDTEYMRILQVLFDQGVAQLDRKDLVLEVNKTDHERLGARWDTFIKNIAPEVNLVLEDTPLNCIGGLILRTPDNRVRLDNTFEGRLHRLRDRLYEAIQDRLLPPPAGDMAGHAS